MSELEVEASESSRRFGTEVEGLESKGKLRNRRGSFGIEVEASESKGKLQAPKSKCRN